MRETITGLKRYTKDKNGDPLKTKDGKPYERINIQVESRADKWISGFGNSRNKNWQLGEEVDIEVTQNGEYLNFSMPKPVVMSQGLSEADRELLQQIKVGNSMILEEVRRLAALVSVPQESEEPPMPSF